MKIYFTAEYSEEELKPLYEVGEIIKDGWALGLPKFSEEEFMKRSADADIIVTSYDDITEKVIENAGQLKLIVCTRSTPVNVDMAAAKKRKIPVIYTPGRNSDTTAEMTIGLMLSIARKIPMAHMALKAGRYTAAPEYRKTTKKGLAPDMIWDMTATAPYMVFKGTQLKGKRLGILGYGSVGRRVGKIARAFGMELLVYDPYVGEVEIEEFGIRKMENLDELFREADFITCHMKVTPETEGIVSRERIGMMKSGAYLINASRGAVLDEKALIEALREKRIAGAAFDVYASEPIAGSHPYVTELDNVVITPHIAGATEEALKNHTKMLVADIQHFLNGQHMLYEYKY